MALSRNAPRSRPEYLSREAAASSKGEIRSCLDRGRNDLNDPSGTPGCTWAPGMTNETRYGDDGPSGPRLSIPTKGSPGKLEPGIMGRFRRRVRKVKRRVRWEAECIDRCGMPRLADGESPGLTGTPLSGSESIAERWKIQALFLHEQEKLAFKAAKESPPPREPPPQDARALDIQIPEQHSYVDRDSGFREPSAVANHELMCLGYGCAARSTMSWDNDHDGVHRLVAEQQAAEMPGIFPGDLSHYVSVSSG